MSQFVLVMSASAKSVETSDNWKVKVIVVAAFSEPDVMATGVACWSVAVIVTNGAVVSELTTKDAFVLKSQDVAVHAVVVGAALALPAASVNFVAATVIVMSLPSLAPHVSVYA